MGPSSGKKSKLEYGVGDKVQCQDDSGKWSVSSVRRHLQILQKVAEGSELLSLDSGLRTRGSNGENFSQTETFSKREVPSQ